MAIFSCVNPSSHDTLPRKHNNSYSTPLAQTEGSPAPQRSMSAPILHSNNGGLAPSPSPLARNMSRRNGNGAKLLKRSRVTKSMIGVPRDFQHVSHVNQEEALNSKEMAKVADAMRQSSRTQLPSSATMIISMPSIAERKEDTCTPRPSQDQQPTRQSLDLPGRKPAVNKRKAPPPITQSIIKAAGLPPSLATNAPPLPLSPASPSTKNVAQALRGGTPVKLKVKRQSKSPVPADLLEGSASADNEEAAPPGHNGVDGLDGLPPPGGIDDLNSPNAVLTTSLCPSNASGLQSHSGPVRSTTLQNLALSESMEDVYKQAIKTSDLDDSEPQDRVPPVGEPVNPVKPSPSGPLAYMTDSTKIRWDNGMAEIARQLKEQN